jgi:type IV secretory pathway VirJ component
MSRKSILSLKKTLLCFIFFLFLYNLDGQDLERDSLIVSRFGKVFIYKQQGIPANIIILISGDSGWKDGIVEYAKSFVDRNTIVIGVDILTYYSQLRPRREDCYMVAPDFVELATSVERKYNFTGYNPPVIMGYASGATLVYGILAQARTGAFMGGISLGFSPEIELPKRLCQANGLTENVTTAGKSYHLQPDSHLGNHWIVFQGKKDKVCNYDSVANFVKKVVNSELIAIPEEGHNFVKIADFMPQWKEAYNRILTKYLSVQGENIPVKKFTNVPYNIVKEKTPVKNAPIVLLFSGDGGWFAFEQNIAEKLGAYGIPTIGIDTKKYFWTRKTPEKTASDIAEVLNFYGLEWGKTKFIIMGYSQGAEIVPFLVTHFPDVLKSKVISAVMLSPATTTDFEIHITNMIGLGSRQNTYSVIDEINKMPKTNALCIFGDGERTSIPGLLKGTPIKISFIPGDHHYHGNATLIVKTMKDNNVF